LKNRAFYKKVITINISRSYLLNRRDELLPGINLCKMTYISIDTIQPSPFPLDPTLCCRSPAISELLSLSIVMMHGNSRGLTSLYSLYSLYSSSSAYHFITSRCRHLLLSSHQFQVAAPLVGSASGESRALSRHDGISNIGIKMSRSRGREQGFHSAKGSPHQLSMMP
jgi:hypothetical protein